jgi:hypothetical protein
VFYFSLQLLPETFLVPKNIEAVIFKMSRRNPSTCACKVSVIVVEI